MHELHARTKDWLVFVLNDVRKEDESMRENIILFLKCRRVIILRKRIFELADNLRIYDECLRVETYLLGVIKRFKRQFNKTCEQQNHNTSKPSKLLTDDVQATNFNYQKAF